MAGVTIFPAWLGVWAVWLRVAQYGWTPERLLALCGAILCLGYGALYLLAAFRRTGWQDRVRQANLIIGPCRDGGGGAAALACGQPRTDRRQ